jgi:hypothetical protein
MRCGLILLFAAALHAQTEIATVKATTPVAPPSWAALERQLIRAMEEAAPVYLKRFTRPGGSLYGEGPVDDVYEMFINWPLFYAMGADEKLFRDALEEWNAITRHHEELFAPPEGYPKNRRYLPQLYKEFFSRRSDCDWFHISEGMMAFYDFGVADPAIPENIRRARRFAGFYLNEDPGAPNWDPQYKIIRAPFTSSQGPLFTWEHGRLGFVRYRLERGNHASLYPAIRNLEPGWYKDPKRRDQVLDTFDRMVMRGDVAVNLAATGLITNAYLYTGEEKYKRWVLDYVEAWMERVRQNNGIVPDNVGLTGKIGEYRDGQWWGGHFGWTGLYSLHMIHGALTVASECAQLVSGDAKYLDLLRSQLDVILNQARMKDGQMVVPHNYGPNGWENYRPMPLRDVAHLWHESMEPRDWQRIERLRAGSKEDWSHVPTGGDRMDFTLTRYPSLMYYGGRNPDWPEKALRADYEEVCRRMAALRNDKRDVRTIFGDDLYPNNPVITKALAQVTLGAPQTIYNGGLLRARVRYFDPERRRPGLPPDVAALVERLEADRAVVQLVNLSTVESRKLMVQAGAFGEHQFTTVKHAGGETTVNGKYLGVELAPGAGIRLELGMKRFANSPSYAFPWHAGRVPAD